MGPTRGASPSRTREPLTSRIPHWHAPCAPSVRDMSMRCGSQVKSSQGDMAPNALPYMGLGLARGLLGALSGRIPCHFALSASLPLRYALSISPLSPSVTVPQWDAEWDAAGAEERFAVKHPRSREGRSSHRPAVSVVPIIINTY